MNINNTVKVLQLIDRNKEEAINFAKKIFTESRDESYTEEGIQTFYKFLDNKKIINSFKVYGILEDKVLRGMIAVDSRKRHINLFFVEKNSQGKGFGKLLINTILKENKNSYITVNSSRYAVPIYQKFGFEATEVEKIQDGLCFTPMKLILKK